MGFADLGLIPIRDGSSGIEVELLDDVLRVDTIV